MKKNEEMLENLVKNYFDEQHKISPQTRKDNRTLWQLSEMEREQIINPHLFTLIKEDKPKKSLDIIINPDSNVHNPLDIMQDIKIDHCNHIKLEFTDEEFNGYYRYGVKYYGFGKAVLFFQAMIVAWLELRYGNGWVNSSIFIPACAIQAAWADDILHANISFFEEYHGCRPPFVIFCNLMFFQAFQIGLKCLYYLFF